MACIIVVNKIDAGTDELTTLVKNIQDSFGRECVCANLAKTGGGGVVDCIGENGGDGAVADVAETRTNLIEMIVETDEQLMESYLGGETIGPDQFRTLAAGLDVDVLIEEVDGSSLFCEIVKR